MVCLAAILPAPGLAARGQAQADAEDLSGVVVALATRETASYVKAFNDRKLQDLAALLAPDADVTVLEGSSIKKLVNEPALVLANEPTASLDPASGQEVLTLLHELAAGPARTTVLIVTHDQRVLDRADRIVNLVSGRIVSNVRPAPVVRLCEMLRDVPRCAGLEPSTLARIAERMTVERHRPGEEGNRIYLIHVGEAEARCGGGPARTRTTNQTIGEPTAVSHRRVEETVTVRTPMEVYVLTTEAFREVLRTDKALAERVKLHLMSRQ